MAKIKFEDGVIQILYGGFDEYFTNIIDARKFAVKYMKENP